MVGRWRIVAFVARGGSGEVYRAVEANGERAAALKILHRTDGATRARFALEAHVLSELRDPAFPAIFETGEFKGRPWYAEEYLQPLEMPSSNRAVARLILAICRGAGALHALGYVHRDIKPANILSRGGEPVLIDLGLLKKAETPELHPGGAISVVDGRPVGVGTPGYAAPEQFMGGEISPAADVHAIGVLASTCFGGRPPRAWRGIIRRATSSIPSERYPDVASLARAVRCRHLPAALGMAGAAAVAVAAAIAAATAWSRSARPPSLTPQTEEPATEPITVQAPEPEQELSQEQAPEPEQEPKQEPEQAPEQKEPPTRDEPTQEPRAHTSETTPIVGKTVGSLSPGSQTAYDGLNDDEPIVASERLRQKLADQGKNLPSVTRRQIREAVARLEEGMVPIPGRGFEMCRFELTQSIWETIAGFNPSKVKGVNLPVSNVTLADVEEFLESLNALPEVEASGKKYRLPTAEEWEYACLAGGTNGFCRLADGTQITAETLGEVAWCAANSRDKPHPICTKKPNAFGLYDMHGNVGEFTSTSPPGGRFDTNQFLKYWKGSAYNGKAPEKFRADFSPTIYPGQSFFFAGFRLAR